MNNFDNEIICPSCGAHFSVHDEYCPYCGSVNERGDEEQYFRDLEDLREVLGKTADIPDDIVKDEIKKGTKIAITVVIIILVLSALVIFGIFFFLRVGDVVSAKKTEKALEWEEETFAILNEMYDREAYDEIRDYIDNLYVEGTYNKYGSIWNWKHYQFISAYMNYVNILEYEEKMADGTIDDFGRRYSFEMMMNILYERWDIKYDTVKSISKKEYDLIIGYQDDVRRVLRTYYDLSDEEIDGLRLKVTFDPPGEGVNYTKCQEVYKELYG